MKEREHRIAVGHKLEDGTNLVLRDLGSLREGSLGTQLQASIIADQVLVVLARPQYRKRNSAARHLLQYHISTKFTTNFVLIGSQHSSHIASDGKTPLPSCAGQQTGQQSPRTNNGGLCETPDRATHPPRHPRDHFWSSPPSSLNSCAFSFPHS